MNNTLTTISMRFHQLMSAYNIRMMLFAGLAAVIFAVVGGGYWWYASSVNERAQSAFARCLEEYGSAYHKQDANYWHEVETACHEEYERYKGSSVAPYFKVLEADALLFQKKSQEALTMLQSTLEKIPSASPLYYLFKTKAALLAYDLTGSSDALETLAQNAKNPCRDMAQFYLGYEAWLAGDTAKAQEQWQQLLQQSQSIWSQRAAAELKYAAS